MNGFIENAYSSSISSIIIYDCIKKNEIEHALDIYRICYLLNIVVDLQTQNDLINVLLKKKMFMEAISIMDNLKSGIAYFNVKFKSQLS